ncbi:hypothetical protein EXIGLDRAFT_779282 [Exidia glandulosa HHB12029]|uniref:Uncharacterized protein n=1 Tax=Exidia glandulosa HHB12029 TaxID=1314781 RepID=A0A165C550_EXIGL|nr:hypothetical protein EXIGLDRAFT_779282 [Exidia glandulosa HHB12029]
MAAFEPVYTRHLQALHQVENRAPRRLDDIRKEIWTTAIANTSIGSAIQVVDDEDGKPSLVLKHQRLPFDWAYQIGSRVWALRNVLLIGVQRPSTGLSSRSALSGVPHTKRPTRTAAPQGSLYRIGLVSLQRAWSVPPEVSIMLQSPGPSRQPPSAVQTSVPRAVDPSSPCPALANAHGESSRTQGPPRAAQYVSTLPRAVARAVPFVFVN